MHSKSHEAYRTKDTNTENADGKVLRRLIGPQTPAKVLPTYIFSLNEFDENFPPQKSKGVLTCKSSSSRQLKNKNPVRAEKCQSGAKKSLSRSVLTDKNSKLKPQPKKKTPKPVDLNKLVKAASKHCCKCLKFKEELLKQSIFL